MKKTFAIVCLAAGTAALVWGYRESRTFQGHWHQMFSSSTNNRITWLYVGGAVLVTVGAALIYTGRR
ncbi:MAG: DUF3185 family protein [Verrucomicrobiota bacterium]